MKRKHDSLIATSFDLEDCCAFEIHRYSNKIKAKKKTTLLRIPNYQVRKNYLSDMRL
jgi:hypothetical protein